MANRESTVCNYDSRGTFDVGGALHSHNRPNSPDTLIMNWRVRAGNYGIEVPGIVKMAEKNEELQEEMRDRMKGGLLPVLLPGIVDLHFDTSNVEDPYGELEKETGSGIVYFDLSYGDKPQPDHDGVQARPASLMEYKAAASSFYSLFREPLDEQRGQFDRLANGFVALPGSSVSVHTHFHFPEIATVGVRYAGEPGDPAKRGMSYEVTSNQEMLRYAPVRWVHPSAVQL